MDAKKVGEMIKTLRKKIRYTQHDLADSLGVTDKAVSKWERGLNVPDVSILNRLSMILNCEVDNLLEGNYSFLEKKWQGLLILEDNNGTIFSGTMIYGKPLVYLMLSYFVLAGIRNIFIKCSMKDEDYIKAEIGDGKKYGISIVFIDSFDELKKENTMVVYDNPFVYGPNLTKYFQRAMSNTDRVSVLTVLKEKDEDKQPVVYNNYKLLRLSGEGNCYYVPICFIPDNYIEIAAKVFNLETLIENEMIYAEPMGNGMIEYSIKSKEAVYQTATFFHYLESVMGKQIYDLSEIVQKRIF